MAVAVLLKTMIEEVFDYGRRTLGDRGAVILRD